MFDRRDGSTPGTRRAIRRRVLTSVLRVGLITVGMFAIYSLAPLDRRPAGLIAVELLLSLLALALVVGWEIRIIVRSPYPRLQAVEAVAISVPLLIVLFSAVYVELARANTGTFSEPLNRIDALYFTVTVLSTVGFGDITARTGGARLAVTTQMIADLVLVGIIAKVLFGAVQERHKALAHDPADLQQKVIPPG